MSYHNRQLPSWLWFRSLSTRHELAMAACATTRFQWVFKHATTWLVIVALLILQGCKSVSTRLDDSRRFGHASRSIAPEKEASSRLKLSLFEQTTYSNELSTCYYQENGGEDGVPTGISLKAPRCPPHIIYDFSNNAWIDASKHRQPENNP